jgi:acetoin utilization protein AcuB
MLTAKKIMNSNLASIYPDDSVQDALNLMHAKQIRHLPVFDRDQKMVGILSDRDLFKALVFEDNLKTHMKVSNFMSWPVITVHESASVRDIVNIFQKDKVSALIVMNSYRVPAGIITTDDLLLTFLDVLTNSECLPEELPRMI